MTMLINKENLLRQLDDRPPDGWISVQAVRAMIDGEEEYKGRWIYRYKRPSGWECSECGGLDHYIYKFCPNCGARLK